MSKKKSQLLCYTLVISIFLVIVTILGLGIRAFESAGTSSFVLVAACGIFVAALAAYFVMRRPAVNAE